MTIAPPLIIFDLDGTLVDSNRDLIPALNMATEPEGLPPISMEDVGHVVGKGAMQMIERAFAFYNRELEVNGDVHKTVFARFLQRYEDHIADNTVFFPGAVSALKSLTNAGYRHAVCTNKFEQLAQKLLHELGETEHFEVVTGGDTFPVKKPDPTHLTETARLAGFPTDRCIMVGDSINDIVAAQQGNIPVIAVDFGYTDVPVSQLSPDLIISHFDELPDAVRQLHDLIDSRSN